MTSLPLSLYIHLPWCVRKCPYCDFNSHEIKDGSFPEKEYVSAVIRDLKYAAEQFREREIVSIFFGGGTPSIMSAETIGSILEAVDAISTLSTDTEITLEANPGAVDSGRFAAYRRLGVNRLSIGVQSFSDDKLAAIGRIHNGNDALAAFETAVSAGFSNINIDLMYGLPGQTTEEALSDLARAVSLDPTHVSWYQLTIEPNTVFYSKPPTLPDDDLTWQMQTCGTGLPWPGTDTGNTRYLPGPGKTMNACIIRITGNLAIISVSAPAPMARSLPGMTRGACLYGRR